MDYDPTELADYARDVFAEVRNELKTVRFQLRAINDDYQRSEQRIEDLVLELADRLYWESAAGGVEDPPAASQIPY